MIQVRKSEARGHADHGWLKAYHTFSFAEYVDPAHHGFRDLRVINEDRVAPGQGFGKHGHRDMEIITYVLSGALEHEDSMGNRSVLHYGDVQRMSAGKGVLHSEFNHSSSEPVHLLQIWIFPERKGVAPGYEEKHFAESAKRDQWRCVASQHGDDGSIRIGQDAALYASILSAGKELNRTLEKDRHAWIQVARGEMTLNGHSLRAGDGVAVSNEPELKVSANTEAEFLYFDLK